MSYNLKTTICYFIEMPRIVESRFKQAAAAKKNRAVGPDESVAAAKTKSRKLATTTANESTFSASRLGVPLTSSTPAPRKIASKIAPKEKIPKNVSKSINNTTGNVLVGILLLTEYV